MKILVQSRNISISKGTGGWLLCLLSMIVANLSCVALLSFFSTTLPTRRNLLIYFQTCLVLALTCLVDFTVFLQESFHFQCRFPFTIINFKLSPVCCCPVHSSLWTTSSTCENIFERGCCVGLLPSPVLVHLPQHQQDVADIQGRQCKRLIYILTLLFLASGVLPARPRETVQVQHEGPLCCQHCFHRIIFHFGTVC